LGVTTLRCTSENAIYRASHNDYAYADSLFPTGSPVATCQDALDTAAASSSTTPPAGPTSDPRRINETDRQRRGLGTASFPALAAFRAIVC
jgi:hypothetical protein